MKYIVDFLSKPRKFFLVLGGLLAGLYYMTLYDDGKGVLEKIKSSEKLLEEQKKKLEDVLNLAQDLKESGATLDEIIREVQYVRQYLPSHVRGNDLLNIMSSEAKKAEVVISSSRQLPIAKDPKTENIEHVPLQMSLKGTYFRLLTFLSNMTKLKIIINADSLIIRKDSNQSNKEKNPSLTVDGIFITYRYIDTSNPEVGLKKNAKAFNLKGVSKSEEDSSLSLSGDLAFLLEPFLYDASDSRRDPFLSLFLFQFEQKQLAQQDRNKEALPLQRYEVESLKLTGIRWGKNPRALIEVPGGNKAYFVKPNDRIGSKNGYVASIREGEVLVVEFSYLRGKQVEEIKTLKLE